MVKKFDLLESFMLPSIGVVLLKLFQGIKKPDLLHLRSVRVTVIGVNETYNM